MKRRFFICLTILLIAILAPSCEKDKPTGLYDPSYASNPTPIITDIAPPNSTLAGIVKITITGSHFSPIKENNFVYFGKTKAVVLEALANQLIVQSPNVVQDSIAVKVAVLGAELFSNIRYYSLKQPVIECGDFDEFEEPYLVACDKDENLFVVHGRDKKIDKISVAGVRANYATTTFTIPTGIKVGPAGILYIAQKSRYIYCVTSAGSETQQCFRAPGKVNDFDFAEGGVIYAGGDGDNLYLIDPADSSSIKAAEYTDINIKAVRVFNGYVYAGGSENTTNHQYIWRNKILTGNQLSPREIYFDWSEKVDPDSEITAITFAQDGDMYAGTDKSEAIIVIHPDGTFEPLYPGMLKPIANSLCWGNGEYLYICQHLTILIEGDRKYVKNIIKINMLKNGAPYFGRQ